MLFLPLIVLSQTVPLSIKMDLPTKVSYTPKGFLGDAQGLLELKMQPYIVFKYKTSEQLYIKYIDARGVERQKQLGYYVPRTDYEGNTVFFNKDTTKAWYWTLTTYGVPYKMDLPDHFADMARTINK